MLKKLLLCLVACFSLCCTGIVTKGPESDGVAIRFHASSTFTADERASISDATDMWRNQTSGLAQVDVIYDDAKSDTEPLLLRAQTNDPDILMLDIAVGCDGPCILGYTTKAIQNTKDTEQLTIVIVTDRSKASDSGLKMVIVHEMGHALGLRHIPDSYAVMYPYSNPDQKGCLTQPDLAEFCRVNRCGSVELKPCR